MHAEPCTLYMIAYERTRASRTTRVVAFARSLARYLSLSLRVFLRVRKKYERHKRERMRGAREGGQCERPSDRTSEGEGGGEGGRGPHAVRRRCVVVSRDPSLYEERARFSKRCLLFQG